MRKSLMPFRAPGKVSIPKGVGGAKPIVQQTSESVAGTLPMLAARIYAPGAMKHYDDSDPRFEGKSDAVENIYQPAPVEEKPRSGVMQILSWLTTGVLR